MFENTDETQHVDTIVIGGGQAGLSVGYHLARRGLRFLILEERDRVGDAWRSRWDSLRLFTPARYDGLDGMPFPADPQYFPTKDEMGDYLERYARRFELPVLTGARVQRVTRQGTRFMVEAGGRRFEADNVVVAMGNWQRPRVPELARRLDPAIVQLHSAQYRGPAQLREGPVLLVGAGNSGAEIAKELVTRHRVWLSGRDVGHLPFRIAGFVGRTLMVRLVLRGVFYRVLTVDTPLGRKVRPKVLHGSGPLIRVLQKDLDRMGVSRVPKLTDVKDGRPVLADGQVLDVANVIWCTGFHHGFDWLELPVFAGGEPVHRSGIVDKEPGLYFVGLHFLHAMASEMVHGVGRDAERVVRHLAARRPPESAGPARQAAGRAAVRAF